MHDLNRDFQEKPGKRVQSLDDGGERRFDGGGIASRKKPAVER